jgi:hypothetical protein
VSNAAGTRRTYRATRAQPTPGTRPGPDRKRLRDGRRADLDTVTTGETAAWHVLPASTSPATSGWRSRSPTSSGRSYPLPGDPHRHGHRPRHPLEGPDDDDLSKLRDVHRGAPAASRVTCAARCRPTSAARSRSAATRGSVTAAACRCAASAPRPTRAAARARRRPSPARRRQVRSNAAPHSPAGRTQEGPPQGEEERRPRSRSHQEHVQQHDRVDHRPDRCRDRVGLRRPRRFQGLAQVHAVRRADGRRELPPARRWSTA